MQAPSLTPFHVPLASQLTQAPALRDRCLMGHIVPHTQNNGTKLRKSVVLALR
jgi:hypothetical protein